MKKYAIPEMEDRYFGKAGSPEREAYEYKLKIELNGKIVKTTRTSSN